MMMKMPMNIITQTRLWWMWNMVKLIALCHFTMMTVMAMVTMMSVTSMMSAMMVTWMSHVVNNMFNPFKCAFMMPKHGV